MRNVYKLTWLVEILTSKGSRYSRKGEGCEKKIWFKCLETKTYTQKGGEWILLESFRWQVATGPCLCKNKRGESGNNQV